MPEQTVVLEQMGANDIITVVDSEKANKNGHFELSGISPEPGLYRLHFNQSKFILLSVDKGNIKVSGDWNTLENYAVSGSAESDHLQKFVVGIRGHLRDFNSISIVMDTLNARGNDSMMAMAKKDFDDIKSALHTVCRALRRYARYQPKPYSQRVFLIQPPRHHSCRSSSNRCSVDSRARKCLKIFRNT